jgi:hypothetical protein
MPIGLPLPTAELQLFPATGNLGVLICRLWRASGVT